MTLVDPYGSQGHTCPYKSEINGDDETLCWCTEEEIQSCQDDI